MSQSIGEFCKRMARIELGRLSITWTSTLREPSEQADLIVVKVSGELLEDKILLTERNGVYGLQHKFEDMMDRETVSSSKVVLRVVTGTEIIVESLL